jgi:hypothetical protein
MTPTRQYFLFFLAFLLWSEPLAANQILQCTDKNGRKIFTDDPRICAARAGVDSAGTPVELVSPKVHSQFGGTISEEYRNYSFRTYSPVAGYSIHIMAEDALIEEAPGVLKKASDKLDRTMAEAVRQFPSQVHGEFAGITYYLFTGDEANTGGRRGGQWYFRRGNSVSKRFDDSIVVRSASLYLKHSHGSAVATGVHELAHAYYYYHRRMFAQKTRDAYQNALSNGLYRNTKTKTGYPIIKAYALTNEREYFAELSKTYLYKSSTFPFTRQELEQYDPMGYQLMRNVYRF